jgi:hypothetical protein
MFYAFRQLKTILRDRPFTVQTDSRGFRFMRNDSNPYGSPLVGYTRV